MKKLRKLLALTFTVVLAVGMLAGCSKEKDKDKQDNQNSGQSETPSDQSASEDNDGKGRIYYLNFKPESAAAWEEIAKIYEQETGIPVKVVTAASGEYESTLKSEISKKDAPTLFQINGPVGYQAWKDYTLDLKDTDLYSWINDPSMAISGEDGGVYGIPFALEGYGIIYNDEIMQKYFALPDKAVSISSADEINNFTTLKQVVEDMTAKKDQLGIKGVFASTSFSAGNDWRWQTHLMNVPMHYEFQDAKSPNQDQIQFTYNENFKNIFDLYINNSVSEPNALGSKSVDDSMAEFARGEAAMVQNGNWGWGQVKDTNGNVVKEENVKFLPIYIGVKGEENQGLCLGTENFLCVNSQASEIDQKASIDFAEWLYSSDQGRKLVVEKLAFVTPFNTFSAEEAPTDPLAKEMQASLSDENKNNVTWDFIYFPSQEFKDMLGADLLSYAQGNLKWEELVSNTVQNWADERAYAAE